MFPVNVTYGSWMNRKRRLRCLWGISTQCSASHIRPCKVYHLLGCLTEYFLLEFVLQRSTHTFQIPIQINCFYGNNMWLIPFSSVFDKLIVAQIISKFLIFCGNWNFITVFSGSFSRARKVHCHPLYVFSIILILSSHVLLVLLNSPFPSNYLAKILRAFLVSRMRVSRTEQIFRFWVSRERTLTSGSFEICQSVSPKIRATCLEPKGSVYNKYDFAQNKGNIEQATKNVVPLCVSLVPRIYLLLNRAANSGLRPTGGS